MTRVITEIYWAPSQGFDPRTATTFSDSDKIRLDPADYKIKLKLDSSFRYPVDADLYIRSQTYRPEAVRQLQMIQVNTNAVEGTSIGLRLFDGTDERYWDGGSWAIATPSDWNTESEINANIATFDVATSRQFAIVLNLQTIDDKVTPEVESVLVLWQGEVDWVDDILTDSLVGMLQDELDWIVDLALPPLPSASGSIDLDEYTDESNLDIVDAASVYDHTADPHHLANLLSSYDPNTHILTILSSIPTGHQPFLRMKAKVHVAWDTHRDFEEVGRLPQIILRDTENVNSSSYPHSAQIGIVRKDTGEAVEIPAPYRATYQITMEVRTDRSREQQRVQESIMRILRAGPSSEEGPFLRSRATDRRYRLWLTDEFRASAPNVGLDASGVRSHQVEFRIEDVALQLRPAVDSFMVKQTKLQFANVPSGKEQLALNQGAPVPHTTVESFDV